MFVKSGNPLFICSKSTDGAEETQIQVHDRFKNSHMFKFLIRPIIMNMKYRFVSLWLIIVLNLNTLKPNDDANDAQSFLIECLKTLIANL